MSERVRNVNSTDTSRTGAAEAGADPDDENRIDFGTLFPAKGDSRRPPEWFGRALLYVALAVIVFMFCWRSWGDISYLVLDIIISLFLALPVTASLQAIFRAYTKRYELIDSPLMNDPTPEKKSKIVEASEAFGEHVLQPIGEHMPRAAKGSTSRVPMNEELRLLQEQIYAIPPHETKESDLDDSATVAIPQRGAADTQQSEQPKQRKQTKQSDQSASSNPRAGWR